MILRNNLASAPIKNYSIFFIGCTLLVLAGIGFTVFNVWSLSNYYVESDRLGQRIQEQQKKTAEAKDQGKKLRAQITQVKTPDFIAKADFINNAIKRRVFSWTKLFDQFEQCLPDNVKMVSVYPRITEKEIDIDMEVAGHNLNEIVGVVTAMENWPAFSNVYFKSERQDTDGLLHAAISLNYLPDKAVGADEKETSVSKGDSVEEPPADEETPVQDEEEE